MADTSTTTRGADTTFAAKLNWLRAGVLGANDGIVSTAGLVFGVAGATQDSIALLIAGLAGLVAGALSMAGGEYVSVSSQRDTEIAALANERLEIERDPAGKLRQLADHFAARGMSDALATQVAEELTEHDALAAHALTNLGIDSKEQTSPWHAAWASMIAFTLGALIPLRRAAQPGRRQLGDGPHVRGGDVRRRPALTRAANIARIPGHRDGGTMAALRSLRIDSRSCSASISSPCSRQTFCSAPSPRTQAASPSRPSAAAAAGRGTRRTTVVHSPTSASAIGAVVNRIAASRDR